MQLVWHIDSYIDICIFVYTYINRILYLKSCKPISNIDIVSGLVSGLMS